MIIEMHISFEISIFSPNIYPEVELLNHMVVLFSVFFSNFHIIFLKSVYQFTFPLTVYKDSLFSTSLLTCIICRVFDYAFLTGTRCYLIVILICISLMLSIVEHLFMCLIVIYIFGQMSIQDFSLYFDGLFIFLILKYMSCVYMLNINPMSVILFANMSSHSVDCLFVLLMVSFAVQKDFTFN